MAKKCARCDNWLPDKKQNNGFDQRFCSKKCRESDEQTREYYANGKNTRLQRMYGITASDFDRMFEEQGGLCAICHLPETQLGRGRRPRTLCVDHNAETGQVRGLLCAKCNLAIGNLREDPALFTRAVEYILKWS